MAEQTITLFDTETGGLDETQNPITEFAALNFDLRTFKVNWEYQTFVKPYCGLEIDPIVLEKTMVTMKDINNGITSKELVKELIVRFKDSNCSNGKERGNTILAGHNIIAFDRLFMEFLFNSEGKNFYASVQKRMHDTYCDAEKKWIGDGKKLNLTECLKRIGYQLTGAHGAMSDVRGNFELYKYLVSSIRNDSSKTVTQDKDNKTKTHRKYFNF